MSTASHPGGHLNKVKNAEIRFLRIDREDEVKCGIVAIYQLARVELRNANRAAFSVRESETSRAAPNLSPDSPPFQIVAERIWSLRDLLKNSSHDTLLLFFVELFGARRFNA